MSKSKHGFWWWVLIGWWWWPCRALVYDIPRLIILGAKSLIGKTDKRPQKRGALIITHKGTPVAEEPVVTETASAVEAEPVPVETPVAEEPVPVVEEPMVTEPAPTVEKPAPAETPAVEEPAPALAPSAPKEPRPAPKKVKTYKVAGVSYRLKNIMELAAENDFYSYSKKELIKVELTGQRVWKYVFCADKVELVPEPDNPQDPNAIKVIIDGLHVGYIKAGTCAHLLKVIREGRLGKIEAVIGGGPYKYVGCVDYTEDGDEVYGSMERGDVPYYVRLEIEEK